ncbi:hypothetical protein [Sphingomonas aerophila]|uniref:Uncharacterized protein n=1 Tax=Sphingomonas aerophila TaxID=1344948 RepID=A0A7W9BA27_9SPHN|nr:hypothetical protein [Sphingomonas aerophila]MBB5713218.1 hypothetical protein [Sphingomonas aerophila]
MTLLSLPDGTSSLEFATDDIATVKQAISDLFGGAASEWFTTYSRVVFGGETFLFENEWDDPCLIASTEAGRRLLTLIERLLSRTAP